MRTSLIALFAILALVLVVGCTAQLPPATKVVVEAQAVTPEAPAEEEAQPAEPASVPSTNSGDNPEWHYDVEFKGFVIDNPIDGNIDVHMDDTLLDSIYGPIIMSVQAGAPTKFVSTVPGEVVFCVGEIYLNDVLVVKKSNCDGEVVRLDAGTIIVRETRGPTGGYRWSPQSGFGWRIDEPTTCPPLDGVCWSKTDYGWDWNGDNTGMADVHQAAAPEVLEHVRAGGTITLTMTVPTQVIDTCFVSVYQDGNMIGSHDSCEQMETPILLEPGEFVLVGGGGESGGWRVSPRKGFGWRVDEQ